jgi:hypothetical protein
MGVGLIPGDIDGAGGMFVDQGLQPFGDLPATFAVPEQHPGFARMVVDGAQAIPFIRLTGRGHHDVLTPRAPHGAQGRQPTDIECVSSVKHRTGLQMVAGVLDRLFFTEYSGSGLLIVWWGRLSTMPAGFSARRTVSPDRFIGHSNAGPLGHEIDPSLERPP